MRTEERLVDFVCNARFEDFPEAVRETIKNQFLTIAGTIVAGTAEDGRERRFHDCLNFAKKPIDREKGAKIVSMVQNFERIPDVREFIPLLLI